MRKGQTANIETCQNTGLAFAFAGIRSRHAKAIGIEATVNKRWRTNNIGVN